MKVTRHYYYVPVLLLMLATACTNRITKLASASPPPGIAQVSDSEDPRILILQFAAFKTNSGKDSITLASTDIVSGFLKTDMAEELATIPAGKLRCTLLDANDQPLKSAVVDHPLQQSLELPPTSAEDEGHNHVKVNVEKGAFMIRARFTSAIKSVVLEKSDNNNNPEYRIKFDIAI